MPRLIVAAFSFICNEDSCHGLNSVLSSPTNVDARLELMQKAATDERFLADLNATLEDFGHADQEDYIA